MRNSAWLLAKLPSLFGLAPCGVYPAPGVTAGAVRSYRTISPLPRHQSRKRLRGRPPERGVAEAVSFLWHWPSTSLEARVPDVIRHTALRSSDFPPPVIRRSGPPAATARSSCQGLFYSHRGFLGFLHVETVHTRICPTWIWYSKIQGFEKSGAVVLEFAQPQPSIRVRG